jgi:hypothetical protein
MTLPTYSSSKHHIGLQASGGTNYGFMLEGGYAKEMQREGLGAPDMGGATDVIGQTPSMSRWTQDDFVGGMFGYHWGRDDAMFADCMNMIPGAQSRSLFSCPPIIQKKALDPDAYGTWVSDTPKSMFMVGGSIYLCFGNVLVRYRIDTDALSTVLPTAAVANGTYAFAEWDSTDQTIWTIINNATRPQVVRYKSDLSAPSYDVSFTGPADTDGMTCYGGTIFNQNIVTMIGRRIWAGDPPLNPDPSASSDTTWTDMGRLPGRWRDSVGYQGMLYILVNDGSFKSHVYAFDGDTVMPICSMPFSFYGKCMIEYAGRIYVGGTGTDVNGGEHYAELYEITGASVRLVRSFSPETRHQFLGGLAGEWPRTIDDMAVHEGMLWFAQKGKRWVTYDITSDGFFGAAEMLSLGTLEFAKFVTGRGRVWGFGVDSSTDGNHGIYRIAQPADSPGTWYPTLVTSDFMYEPGMDKRWSQISVMTKYAPLSSLDYSVDGGESWTALTIVATNTNSKVYFSTATLAAIAPSKLIRFRMKLNTSSPNDAKTYHRELISFTVSYAMLDTGKLSWGLTVNGSVEIETLDAELDEGVTQAYTPSEVRRQLWSWVINKTPLTFTDVTGDTYSVQAVGCRENLPVIGPDITADPEAFYALTLMEV